MWQFSIFIGNRHKHKTTDIWRCANEDQCVPDKTGCSCRTITRSVRPARQGCWCCACRSSSPVLHESYCRITSGCTRADIQNNFQIWNRVPEPSLPNLVLLFDVIIKEANDWFKERVSPNALSKFGTCVLVRKLTSMQRKAMIGLKRGYPQHEHDVSLFLVRWLATEWEGHEYITDVRVRHALFVLNPWNQLRGLTPVASFTKEVNSRLAKRPLLCEVDRESRRWVFLLCYRCSNRAQGKTL